MESACCDSSGAGLRVNARTRGGATPEAAPVALVDSVPVYRLGLRAACEDAGVRAVELDGASDSAAELNLSAVVAVVRSESDWRVLAACATTHAPVVAVLPRLTAAAVKRALAAGATSVIAEFERPEKVMEAIWGALELKSVLPSGVLRGIVRDATEGPLLSADERRWLQALREGLTVAQLARRVGYSERELYPA